MISCESEIDEKERKTAKVIEQNAETYNQLSNLILFY